MDRLEIDKCYQIMRRAHYRQVDKAGKEYIGHPLIVAHNVYLYFSKYLDEDEYKKQQKKISYKTILELSDAGKTPKEIVAETGYSSSFVYKVLRNNGRGKKQRKNKKNKIFLNSNMKGKQ